jgi:predicted phosphate transport protein (TIGR00153 family)
MKGLKSIIPRDEVFFDFFDKICAGIVDGVQVVRMMLESSENSRENAQRLKTIEHQTDQLVHGLMAHLHKTFVTPFDRDEIHELAGRLDDILDMTEAAGSRIDLFCPECAPSEARELADVLLESANLVREMVGLLRKFDKPERILELTVEINRLEDQADYIRRSTVARLFREEKNPVELIKWKDILEFLEKATDRCEDVANITEGIVLEHR